MVSHACSEHKPCPMRCRPTFYSSGVKVFRIKYYYRDSLGDVEPRHHSLEAKNCAKLRLNIPHVKWDSLRFESKQKILTGNIAISDICINFVQRFVHVGWIIHHTQMLPVYFFTSTHFEQRKVRIYNAQGPMKPAKHKGSNRASRSKNLLSLKKSGDYD